MDTTAPYPEIIEAVRKAGGQPSRFCFQCGKCDVVCPWNRVRPFSMRRLVREANLGLSEIDVDDIWRCTTCGTCPTTCPRGVGQIQVGVAVRRVAASYDVFSGAAQSVPTVRASLTMEGNPLQQERCRRDAWAEGLDVKPFAEGMELLYFVGCYGSYDPRMRKATLATVKILKHLGVDFGILGTEESCCGESIRKTGNEEVFRALAKRNIKTFVDRGVTRILVTSPHCYQAFENEYRDFMVHFEVVHLAELLSEALRDGRLRLEGSFPKKVTYHDPCYLGRHNGIYEEPRDVLRAVPGLDLVEMRDHHKQSLCCGGGGGRIWMDTPKGERFSDIRLGQAKEAGADVLVTSCPYCISNFEDSRFGLEDEGAPAIMDLVEIVAASIGKEQTP